MDSQFHDVAGFANDVIPGLVSGRKSARLYFSNYNSMRGYDGVLETGDPNLQMFVAHGQGDVTLDMLSRMALADALDDNAMRSANVRASRAIADEAQRSVDEQLASSFAQQGRPDIVLLYAGLRAFNKTLESARKLKSASPDTYVAVLTCDCDMYGKRREMDPFIGNGIDAAIFTTMCGGRTCMADIIEEFKSRWKDRKIES